MSRENTRAQMPLDTAFIDAMRAAFGTDEIDNQIRRGLHADCPPALSFFATENGHTIGQRYVHAGAIVSGCDLMLAIVKPEAKK